MRPTACISTPTAPRGWGPRIGLLSLLLLSSCATNPLRIPPPPHALPSRSRPAPDSEAVAESRPALVPRGYDTPAPVDDRWRTGDSLAFALEFENCGVREDYWLLVEVVDGLPEGTRRTKASVKTTLLDHDGQVIGTARRRWNPSTIITPSGEMMTAYSEIVSAAAAGESPEAIQDRIDTEMDDESAFSEARRCWFNEMKRTMAPRFVREKLKDPAINSSLGGIGVFDILMAALAKLEVLIDVNRLKDEQAAVANYDDIPVPTPIRVPFVVTIGGAVQFRFAITVTSPVPPYALAGGVLEIAGVNEACGERRLLVRLVSAKRGEAPESRPESRTSPD